MSPKLLLILPLTLALKKEAKVYCAKIFGVNVVLFRSFETFLKVSSALILLKFTGKLAQTFQTSDL